MRELTISASEEIVRRAERRRSRQFWAGLAALTLKLAGFLATTLLLSWGLLALFFFAIGGFSIDGMVIQLHNFTTRYLAAAPARLAAFRHLAVAIYCGAALLLMFLRPHHFLPAPQRSARHG